MGRLPKKNLGNKEEGREEQEVRISSNYCLDKQNGEHFARRHENGVDQSGDAKKVGRKGEWRR